MVSKKDCILKNLDTEEYHEKIRITLNLNCKPYLEASKIYIDRNKDLKEALEKICNFFLIDSLDEVDSIIQKENFSVSNIVSNLFLIPCSLVIFELRY